MSFNEMIRRGYELGLLQAEIAAWREGANSGPAGGGNSAPQCKERCRIRDIGNAHVHDISGYVERLMVKAKGSKIDIVLFVLWVQLGGFAESCYGFGDLVLACIDRSEEV